MQVSECDLEVSGAYNHIITYLKASDFTNSISHTHTHIDGVATMPRIIVSIRSQTYANFREYVLNSISANKLHSSHMMMHSREKEIEDEFVCGHILGLNNKTHRHNHNKTSIERWKAIDTEAKRRRERKKHRQMKIHTISKSEIK